MTQEVERSSTDRKGQRVDPWINRKGCIRKDHNNLDRLWQHLFGSSWKRRVYQTVQTAQPVVFVTYLFAIPSAL